MGGPGPRPAALAQGSALRCLRRYGSRRRFTGSLGDHGTTEEDEEQEEKQESECHSGPALGKGRAEKWCWTPERVDGRQLMRQGRHQHEARDSDRTFYATYPTTFHA
ncbi:hypothetical protein CMUS01_05626 [Colletotrichum musicola]|uniref:Uncharacterized protein n=1 Tax=Colletotrichum musicola TaxID=2175873 RepID=A0A8H6KRC7_9PEZI|nr:hypothetical protein CMUS01_05626 [Colletotrichum musicola]